MPFWHRRRAITRRFLRLSKGQKYSRPAKSTTRTTAYSKIYAMECALIEALHGVNIAGVGTVEFNRYSHPEAGSRAYADEGTHISRVINMSIDWQESREDAF